MGTPDRGPGGLNWARNNQSHLASGQPQAQTEHDAPNSTLASDAVCKTQCDPLDYQAPPAHLEGASNQASAEPGPQGFEDGQGGCFVQGHTHRPRPYRPGGDPDRPDPTQGAEGGTVRVPFRPLPTLATTLRRTALPSRSQTSTTSTTQKSTTLSQRLPYSKHLTDQPTE